MKKGAKRREKKREKGVKKCKKGVKKGVKFCGVLQSFNDTKLATQKMQ